jgi:hypothetical protein
MFVLVISPSNFFLTIRNLKFKIWEIQIDFWDSKIFQIKKLSSTKLYNSSLSITFILFISLFDFLNKARLYIFHKYKHLSCNHITIYEIYSSMNNVQYNVVKIIWNFNGMIIHQYHVKMQVCRFSKPSLDIITFILW